MKPPAGVSAGKCSALVGAAWILSLLAWVEAGSPWLVGVAALAMLQLGLALPIFLFLAAGGIRVTRRGLPWLALALLYIDVWAVSILLRELGDDNDARLLTGCLALLCFAIAALLYLRLRWRRRTQCT